MLDYNIDTNMIDLKTTLKPTESKSFTKVAYPK